MFLSFSARIENFETESCYVTQAGLKLMILLPEPSECLGIDLRYTNETVLVLVLPRCFFPILVRAKVWRSKGSWERPKFYLGRKY